MITFRNLNNLTLFSSILFKTNVDNFRFYLCPGFYEQQTLQDLKTYSIFLKIFVNIRNRSGPNIERRGVPDRTSSKIIVLSLNAIKSFLFDW